MIADTQQIGGRCPVFDHDHVLVRGNFYQTTFTYGGKFSWGVNFVTVRAVTKVTKISPPRNLPAIRYRFVNHVSYTQLVSNNV